MFADEFGAGAGGIFSCFLLFWSEFGLVLNFNTPTQSVSSLPSIAATFPPSSSFNRNLPDELRIVQPNWFRFRRGKVAEDRIASSNSAMIGVI